MDKETKKYIDDEIQKWLVVILENMNAESKKVSMLEQKVLALEKIWKIVRQ